MKKNDCIQKREKNTWIRFINNNGLWGYRDLKTGKTVIPADYDELDSFMGEELVAACKAGKWGFINRSNEVVVPFRYQSVSWFSDGVAKVCYGGLWGFINTRGVEIVPTIYDTEEWMNDDRQVIVSKNNKFGVVDLSGHAIIPCENDKIEHIGNIGYYQVTKNNHQFFVDLTGQAITLKQYDRKGFNIGFYYNNVCKNGLWGVADDNGVEAIPCLYSNPLGRIGLGYEDGDQLVPACVNGKWGFIDLSGVVHIPFLYESAQQGSCGLFPVLYDGMWGFLGCNGEWHIPPKFEAVSSFECGFAIVRKDSKWGVIDESGNVVIAFNYDDSRCISISNLDPIEWSVRGGSCVEIIVNRKHGLLSRDGRLLIPIEFDEVQLILDGVAPVKRDGLWGFYDVIKGLIVPCEYDYVQLNFQGEYAIVTKNRKSLLINKRGEIVLESDRLVILSNDRFLISRNGLYGIVDREDKVISPFEYDSTSLKVMYGKIIGNSRGSFFIKKGDKWAVADANGELLTLFEFSLTNMPGPLLDNTPVFMDGIARVKKEYTEGFIDTWGTFVVDPVWKSKVKKSSQQKNEPRISGPRLFRVYFTDWNGMKKLFTTYAYSKAGAEQNWRDSGVQFGANIDSIE